jgi:hypothetical protein
MSISLAPPRASSQIIQRAGHPLAALAERMRVDYCQLQSRAAPGYLRSSA